MPLHFIHFLSRSRILKRLTDLIDVAVLNLLDMISITARFLMILLVTLPLSLALLDGGARLLLVLGRNGWRRRGAAAHGHTQHGWPRQALRMLNILLILVHLALGFANDSVAIAFLIRVKSSNLRILLGAHCIGIHPRSDQWHIPECSLVLRLIALLVLIGWVLCRRDQLRFAALFRLLQVQIVKRLGARHEVAVRLGAVIPSMFVDLLGRLGHATIHLVQALKHLLLSPREPWHA